MPIMAKIPIGCLYSAYKYLQCMTTLYVISNFTAILFRYFAAPWKIPESCSHSCSSRAARWHHKHCITYTANMCREITVKVHLKNCNFEKLQFFTVDHSSLCFLPVKNCNFSIIFNVVYFALNWMLILQVFTVFKNTTKKL
jgi:hypothetical protein